MSGRLWILWNKSYFDIIVLKSNPQFIHLRVTAKDGTYWILTAIYRIPNGYLGKSFWHEVAVLANFVQEPRMLVGDFNAIASPTECSRKGGSFSGRFFFADWINSL